MKAVQASLEPAPFPVELTVLEEDPLAERLATIKLWLDRRGFEPLTFRYEFGDTAIRLRIDFNCEAEASAFAAEFHGQKHSASRCR